MTQFWLGVVSKKHVLRGVQAGIAQVCHGKKGPLSRMQENDGLIYYSPKIAIDRKEKCQAFTAIGKVKTGEVYQVKITESFQPFRLDVDYFPSQEVPLTLVFDKLELTRKKSWGMQLRRGIVELTQSDFILIAKAMNVYEFGSTELDRASC